MKKILLSGPAIWLLLVPASVADTFMEDGFVARCSPPEGPHVSYGWHPPLGGGQPLQEPSDGFQESRGGFSNMNPIFIWKGGQSGTLLSIWGDTRPEEVPDSVLDALAQKELEKNAVINRQETFVSAVITFPNESWLSTLIPSLGIGYFTYQEIDANPSDERKLHASASALKSKCNFSRLE